MKRNIGWSCDGIVAYVLNLVGYNDSVEEPKLEIISSCILVKVCSLDDSFTKYKQFGIIVNVAKIRLSI